MCYANLNRVAKARILFSFSNKLFVIFNFDFNR